MRALRLAFELGIKFIDTALAFGDGHSEKLVGRAVRESDLPIVIATKIPPSDAYGQLAPARASTIQPSIRHGLYGHQLAKSWSGESWSRSLGITDHHRPGSIPTVVEM
jgi:aryl-alcohol dehydrogenase-like predicted oxidoreductase